MAVHSSPADALSEQLKNEPGGEVEIRISRRSRIEKWLFLGPATFFQLSWGWYPMIIAFLLSFTNAALRNPIEFTGTESYQRMWNDPLTQRAFEVTFSYAAMSVVLTFLIPIVVAIFLMEMPPRMMRWMMLLWFLPLSGIANVVLWRYFYNAQIGLFQYIATDILGMEPQRFLNDSNQVIFWLIFPGILLFGPGLIYMAGLQSIPESYYEAAEIEGAGFWRKIWTISLPRLRPIIAMLLTFAIIGSLQTFDWPQLMTGGGPGGASRTVVLYMYSVLNNARYADATAIAIMLFAVIMTITIIFRVFYPEDPDI